MADTKSKRELVKELIEEGKYTKAEIAEKLEMSPGSVSTQMTYLRWMENYIVTDKETKILSFTDQETFEKLEAEAAANRKTKSTSNRTPEERAVATAKTIVNQTKQLKTWTDKSVVADKTLDELPADVDADVRTNAEMAVKEANAMIDLLQVKLYRNEKLAAELPDVPEEVEEAEDDAADDNEPEDNGVLL